MIDFRYHLVSIVSIFLALAVGIVLGAGPLQGEIGATLKDEVAGLRGDKSQLNAELDAAQKGIEARDGYLAAANPRVLAGTLLGRTVAVVALPGAEPNLVEATRSTLQSAGSFVTSTTTLTEEWATTDDTKSSIRDAVVARVAGNTDVPITDTGSTAPRDVLLASLLVRPAGTKAVAVDPVAARRGLASLSDGGLLSVELPEGGYQRAQLAVVVSGPVSAGDEQAQKDTAKAWVDLVVALDDRSEGTVLAASESAQDAGTSVLATMRGDAAASAQVSGVDDAGDPVGQGSIVHALLGQVGGRTGQYGLAAGAEAPFAPFPTPEATPSPTPTASATP